MEGSLAINLDMVAENVSLEVAKKGVTLEILQDTQAGDSCPGSQSSP